MGGAEYALSRAGFALLRAAERRDWVSQARIGRESELATVRSAAREITAELERLTSRVHRDEVVRAEQIKRSLAPDGVLVVEGFVLSEELASRGYPNLGFESGALLANGSDAPVEDLNPLLGVYAAVTRQDLAGSPADGWYPDQRMTREQVFSSFTLDAAYSGFSEKVNGSIQVGKQADLVVLSRDILACEPREIPRARVETTIVAGKVVYQRPVE